MSFFGSIFSGISHIFNPVSSIFKPFSGITHGLFSVFERAIKAAGKIVLKPVISFLGGLAAVYAAATYDLLKVVLLWLIDLFSMVFGEIVSGLGFEQLDGGDLWTTFISHEWGVQIIFAMEDLGIINAFAIILVAIIIKFILMIIPFIG